MMKKTLLILLCSLASVFCNPTERGKMEEFVLIGKMRAKPSCEAKLEAVLKTLSKGTYTEPGCLFYALHRDMNDSLLFVLVEGWASKEALDAHVNSPHFLKEFPLLSSLIVGEPELTYLTPLSKGKKGNLFDR
jgi:quinol monooxygenase YgiN